jgi:hypothetical protein
MLSPLPVYLDERVDDPGLAPRSPSLDGKVLGLLPNWRPSAVEILQGVGEALGRRFRLGSVVMEQPMREVPDFQGKSDRSHAREARRDRALRRRGDCRHRRLRVVHDVV